LILAEDRNPIVQTYRIVSKAIIKRLSGFRSSVADGPVPLGYSITSMGNGCRCCEGTWCRQFERLIGPRRRIDPLRWSSNALKHWDPITYKRNAMSLRDGTLINESFTGT